MLSVGIKNSPLANWQANFTKKELEKIGQPCEAIILDDLENALLRGDVDVAARSLKNLPTAQPDGLAVTAVSRREDPSEWLVIKAGAVDENQILKLKTGATIACSDSRQMAQMPDFRPDVLLEKIRGGDFDFLKNESPGGFGAAIFSAAELLWTEAELADFQIFKLNPREFLPKPGQGVLAWQTNRDDLPTRRILKKIHHPETAAATNVERKVLQLLGGDLGLPLGVFCERDSAGFFHVFAVLQVGGELRRARLSHSTSFGLAEKTADALKNR